MLRAILPIVEGVSELASVPVLLRRALAELGAEDIQIARPFKVHRPSVVPKRELERAIQLGVKQHPNVAGILVLLDADDDCPAELGPKLLQRCKAQTHLPVSVVLAKKEFEGWFLGAKKSLRGKRGIRQDAEAPVDPEDIRGAKEHLAQNMAAGKYLEVLDQPALAQYMDFAQAREKCPSFDKFWRDLSRLIFEVMKTQQ